VAVVALYDPSYDEATSTATYEVEALAGWARTADEGFAEAEGDLAARLPSFGAAHLFIDSCEDFNIQCIRWNAEQNHWDVFHEYGYQGFCWNYGKCVPCVPYYHSNPYDGAAWAWWTAKCNEEIAACADDACVAGGGY
jgi:hypothetical protein